MFCESRTEAEETIDRLKRWLADRGLALSPEKTRIVHATEGFDFLGFTIRLYKRPRTRTGYRLLVTPSTAAEQALRDRLREDWVRLRSQPLAVVLARLTPLIRGWATYFRRSRCSPTFRRLDWWMHRRKRRWAEHRHPRRSSGWHTRRYWGTLKPGSQDRWVFGDKRSGAYLLQFAWFTLVKHTLVRGTASPDDPRLRDDWATRRAAHAALLTPSRRKLAKDQGYVCPVCGDSLFTDEELHDHHIEPRAQGGSDARANRDLVHLYGHQQIHHEPSRRWLRPWLA